MLNVLKNQTQCSTLWCQYCNRYQYKENTTNTICGGGGQQHSRANTDQYSKYLYIREEYLCCASDGQSWKGESHQYSISYVQGTLHNAEDGQLWKARSHQYSWSLAD